MMRRVECNFDPPLVISPPLPIGILTAKKNYKS